jgi:hypothetical protein
MEVPMGRLAIASPNGARLAALALLGVIILCLYSYASSQEDRITITNSEQPERVVSTPPVIYPVASASDFKMLVGDQSAGN